MRMTRIAKHVGIIVAVIVVVTAVYWKGKHDGLSGEGAGFVGAAVAQSSVSPTKARPRDVYFPNSEDLGPNEMRIISLGTGMPSGRRSQASCSWLVELGNGDKFIFDIGTGAAANLGSLEIPYDYLDKVFLSHLHTDHMGDMPALFVGGVVAGRLGPLRVWGPSGSEQQLGTGYSMRHLQEFVTWDVEGRKGRLPSQALAIEVNEFNYMQQNQVVYEENGVIVRAWPAIHSIDGPVSYSLEWNGLKFVFGGDTYPNKWFIENAKNADIAIHECMMTADDYIAKYNFPPSLALEIGTQIHTSPEAFGKVMSAIEPRMAIAYHFFADFDVLPGINDGIRATYSGPLSLADDMMAWNVTDTEILVRIVAPIEDAWPAPAPREKPPVDRNEAKDVSEAIMQGVWPVADVVQPVYDRINKAYGTEFVPHMK
jgi:ribonuclease Z